MQPTRRSDLSALIKFFSNAFYPAESSVCRSVDATVVYKRRFLNTVQRGLLLMLASTALSVTGSAIAAQPADAHFVLISHAPDSDA